MDILVVLFVVILIVIDSNVRRRVIAALAAAVNLRHSFDTDNDTHDTHDTRSDTRDIDSDTEDTRRDTHVTSDDTDNDTHVTVSHDAIDAVARLVAADVISATRACQIAFNVSQRGNAAVYRAVRARAAELKKMSQMSQMSQRDDIVDIRHDGRVIRCDVDGRRYVIYANGKKEYIEEKEINA